MTATNTSRLGNIIKPKKTDVVTSKLLEKAARILEMMIESGAGDIQTRLLDAHFGFSIA